MTYTPDQIARAREIYASFKRWGSGSPFWDDIRKGLAAGVFDNDGDMKAILAAIAATEAHVTEREADGWESGMRDAANICGSLAETTYDDADAFEAAAGCEAAIVDHLRAHQRSRKEHLQEPSHEQ